MKFLVFVGVLTLSALLILLYADFAWLYSKPAAHSITELHLRREHQHDQTPFQNIFTVTTPSFGQELPQHINRISTQSTTAGARLAILSAYDDQFHHNFSYLSQYAWSIRNKNCYIAQHPNTSFIMEIGPFDFLKAGMPAAYAKPYLIKKYLDYYDWVVWMDFDMLITNLTASLGHFLVPGYDVIVQDTRGAYFNNGMFFVKSSERGRAFLDTWIDRLETKCWPYLWFSYDQNAWLDAILTTLNSTRGANVPPYLGECSSIPACLRNEQCHAQHFELLEKPYGQRNGPNQSIYFWKRDVEDAYRAFGLFVTYPVEAVGPEGLAHPRDITWHVKYNDDAYKQLQARSNLSLTCQT